MVLNWNGIGDTIECLESLQKIVYPNYEVIVVDNGSDGDDVRVLQERFGDYIHLIRNDRNYGFAEGNNIGIRYALKTLRPDYVLLLNNDTVVDLTFLGALVGVGEAGVDIGVVGAKIYDYVDRDGLQFVWGRVNLWLGQQSQVPRIVAGNAMRREIDRGQYDHIKDVKIGWVAGSCLLIKLEALQKVGLLDADYTLYWEEVDYCVRAGRAGYRVVYTPWASIWHKGGGSAKGVFKITYYYHFMRSRFRFMKKHASRWQYRCFLLYFFGFYFWLSMGHYLIGLRSLKVFNSFYQGVKDGLKESVK